MLLEGMFSYDGNFLDSNTDPAVRKSYRAVLSQPGPMSTILFSIGWIGRRIIPFSRWLVTMFFSSPPRRVSLSI